MILVPTLNRIKLLQRFLDSVTSTNVVTPGLILVDEKDLEANDMGYSDLVLPHGWEIVNTKNAISMGDKVRFVWDRVSTSEWVGILNDDHVCITEGWDKKVEKLLDGKNMVSTNDGHWNFGLRVCGLTAWSMGLLRAVGFPIYPRNLQHLYIDDAWKAIGESSGCWIETNKVNIEHRHALKGDMEQDETFKKVYSPGSWEFDAKEFKNFMEQDFKGVCERISKLRSEQSQSQKFG